MPAPRHTHSPCLTIHPVRAAVCATLRHTRWRQHAVGIGLAATFVSAHGQGFVSTLELSSLDGTNGFAINGVEAYDRSGQSVSSAGDVNGDGVDDLIIGAKNAGSNGNINAGTSYVVFGQSAAFASTLELSSLDGTNGFAINGVATFDSSGDSVSSAGDVNGDGFDDLIIGARGVDSNRNIDAGTSYVVFGQSAAFASTLELSSLDGTNGFAMNGVEAYDSSGRSVSSAGDVNGDGVDDLIIGAKNAAPNGIQFAGTSYVVFGQSAAFASTLELSSLDGTNGFAMNGVEAYDYSGLSVSSAGDVNGDGVDDVIIGADDADPNGIEFAGTSYVVFGQSAAFASTLELSSLDGTNGFAMNGVEAYDRSGQSVSSAGDVNGDGVDDLIIGAWGADPNGNGNAGTSYVVFGQSAAFASTLELSSLDGTNGFAIDGLATLDFSGISVSSAGDVNGDWVDDLIIGAWLADPNDIDSAGTSYVVFGQSAAFASTLALSSLDGTNGFAINGVAADDKSGRSVSSAGDVNGDGVDDVIIGAENAAPNDIGFAGTSYVVFGRDTTPNAPWFDRVSQELERRAPITNADIDAIALDIADELQITLEPDWVYVVQRFGASDATNLENRLTPLKQRAGNYFQARQRAVENGNTLVVWKRRHAQLLSIRARRSLSPAEAARLQTAKDQIRIRTVRQTHWKKLRDRHNRILQNNIPETELNGTTVSFPYQRYLASLL